MWLSLSIPSHIPQRIVVDGLKITAVEYTNRFCLARASPDYQLLIGLLDIVA